MNVNGLLTKRWLSHLESNQNSGYQKPVCSRYTMGQAELRILYHISFIRRPRVVDCLCYAGLPSNVRLCFGAGLPSSMRLASPQRCSPGEKWPIHASLRPLDIYIYVFGSQSCATRLIFAGSAPLAAAEQAAHGTLGSSARCSGARPLSRSLHRRSRRLHGDTRRNASSANTPPRLATCLTAHPTNRVAACRSVRRSPPRPLPHLP